MGNRGLAGMMVLWLLSGASALAFGALAMAKRQDVRGSARIAETQALYLAYAGAQLAQAADFPSEIRDYAFSKGTVTAAATPAANDRVILHLSVQAGRLAKNFETSWKRVSGRWQALSWREL